MVFDKNLRQSPIQNCDSISGEMEQYEENRAARCRQKLLCELDSFRQLSCQGKINNILVRVQKSSHSAAKEKVHQQENVWLANQAKYLKEEQEIYHKLHEEEEESRKRQEQLVYEHEQHAKRVNEISRIIKGVEERERENEERNRRLHLHKRMLTEKCHTYVLEYRTIYEKFLEALKSCKDKRTLGEKCASSVTKLRYFSELMNQQIPEKCKNLAVSDDDLNTCTRILEEAKLIVEKMEEDIKLINREHDQIALSAKQKEESAAAAAAAAAAATSTHSSVLPQMPSVQETQNTTNPNSQLTNVNNSSALREYVNESVFKKYTSLNDFQEKFAKSYENLLRDQGMKTFRFECQKAVNTPVNAISPISASHLQDKFLKLHRLLSGQAVDSGSGRSHFSASQHPQGIAFCKDLLAKKFVGQGDTTVSCKPEAAFAIAAVVVSLWVEFPDFGQLLLAHFYKECPYLLPFFKPRLIDQSDVDYYKSLGYRYSETGEVEKQDKFLKRMSGIMHLYCAIIVTPLKRHSTKPHPVGISEAWRWIANVINLDPRPDICATLLYEFLEVAGHFMYKYYGQIFQKVLHLLCTEYYHKLEEVTPNAARGPVARLESFLQKILKQGRINPPTGILPVDFW
ncbi:hypothetical protein R5R35_013932 [Gryllus longicercus]